VMGTDSGSAGGADVGGAVERGSGLASTDVGGVVETDTGSADCEALSCPPRNFANRRLKMPALAVRKLWTAEADEISSAVFASAWLCPVESPLDVTAQRTLDRVVLIAGTHEGIDRSSLVPGVPQGVKPGVKMRAAGCSQMRTCFEPKFTDTTDTEE